MLVLNLEQIKNLIAHHTATSRDRTTFDAVKNYHINTCKFGDIGYHWFITGDGVLHKGRDEKWVGAHCKTSGYSMNFQSLGICLTGNFMKEKPTSARLKTLEKLLDSLRGKYKIDIKNVFGHREKRSTLCPGTHLMSWIKKYREQKPKPVPIKEDKKVGALAEIVKIIKKYNLC